MPRSHHQKNWKIEKEQRCFVTEKCCDIRVVNVLMSVTGNLLFHVKYSHEHLLAAVMLLYNESQITYKCVISLILFQYLHCRIAMTFA